MCGQKKHHSYRPLAYAFVSLSIAHRRPIYTCYSLKDASGHVGEVLDISGGGLHLVEGVGAEDVVDEREKPSKMLEEELTDSEEERIGRIEEECPCLIKAKCLVRSCSVVIAS